MNKFLMIISNNSNSSYKEEAISNNYNKDNNNNRFLIKVVLIQVHKTKIIIHILPPGIIVNSKMSY